MKIISDKSSAQPTEGSLFALGKWIMGKFNDFSGKLAKLIKAVENDDVKLFRALKPTGKDLRKSFTYEDCRKWNLLHLACYRKSLNIIREIVVADPSLLSSFDKEGKSPLHIAIRVNCYPAVEYLIEKGADVDFSSNEKESVQALPMFIAMFRDMKIMELIFAKSPIIASGAHTAKVSDDGVNIFAYELISILLSLFPQKAADTGIAKENIEEELIARLMFLHKIDTDFNAIAVSTGSTVLNLAIELDYPEVLKYLVSIGVDPNVEDFQGGFACDYAMAADKPHLIEVLQKAGGRFNIDEMRERFEDAANKTVFSFKIIVESITDDQEVFFRDQFDSYSWSGGFAVVESDIRRVKGDLIAEFTSTKGAAYLEGYSYRENEAEEAAEGDGDVTIFNPITGGENIIARLVGKEQFFCSLWSQEKGFENTSVFFVDHEGIRWKAELSKYSDLKPVD